MQHAQRAVPRLGSAKTRRRAARLLAAAAALAVLAPASAAFAAGGVTSGADVQVTGSASTGSPAPGAAFTYTFQLRNSGPDSATGLTFNDPLPTGTVYNYATLNGSTLPCAAFGNPSGGATASCNVGSLAKGASATVVVSVNAPQVVSTFANIGSVTATSTDPVATNNAATVSVQVKAPAGGGGVNKGGVNDTTPAPATPCATLAAVSAPVGYYSVWAAIWNTFTIRSCSSSTQTVNVRVTETNVATGSIDYDLTMPLSLLGGQNSSMVLDNDFAPFDTTYRVDMTATDASGNVLSTGSVLATTPPPQ
jgi:uncharacterized repeat protein (TIGR01451 family)